MNESLKMTECKPIAESPNYIVLDKYEKDMSVCENGYQLESELERDFVDDLKNLGYEYLPEIKNSATLLSNVRLQLENLNNVHFSDSEWNRYVQSYLDKPSDTLNDKARNIHDNYIFDFVFDDGHIQNIYLFDKEKILRNHVQVIRQFEQTGTHQNRYDVTILVNGIPLVQVELKKRGVAIREAFNQVHRYSKESFNSEHSLYKYLQIFVISNGTDTRYFANTTKRNKNSFDFTMNWAKSDNTLIKDLKDFTQTFFQKNTLLNILFTYSVFDTSNTLLVMRPYQIAAAERLLWKIKSSYLAKNWSNTESGGYIWHTTGSGKTLTSFKAAQLATNLDFIDKVLFVVDRKDLDYQTMKEYQRFSPDSVNGSESTAGLKRNLESNDNKITVTTIQKLNNLMKSEDNLAIYKKQVVFIFDECHRSQFGEAQKNLKKKFKFYYQFGFTGTPIFPENALGSETTASVFGRQLHSYIITDAIRDEKVLKFKVDYNDVRPKFKEIESEQDEAKLSAAENKAALLHPDRIKEITQYVLDKFNQKTHRNAGNPHGFNAMFAVSSVEAAKMYYEMFKTLQKDKEKPLKVATIFSFVANEEQNAIGEIQDESFETSALDSSSKEFLDSAINDYNKMFKTNFSTEGKEFQNYYRDLSLRVKSQEIDLLLVVGMFLTGFDAPQLNTLFVDKNLRYHGLIQAYSRTNRIYDSTKTFGNIVTFRDLEQATVDAIKLFGATNHIILEKSYDEYMQGFFDNETGESCRGYLAVIKELEEKFPNPDEITKEKNKIEFTKLFGEYLRIENVLQNYDEFAGLKAFSEIDKNDEKAVADFKEKFYLSDETIDSIKDVKIPSERTIQNYKSAYNDIRDWLRVQKESDKKNALSFDWNDVVFEVDLLKSQEINLDYILELIFENNKKNQNKEALLEDARRLIRSSIGNRAKESLLVDFINKTNLDQINDKATLIDEFFKYAQKEQLREIDELIAQENLKEEEAKRYIALSLKKEYASENGTELNSILPKMSPLNPNYLTKKHTVFQKITALVEKFKGVGGL